MSGVRAAQREQTRERLVTTARALFAERGYAAVGLAEVVATAGVTKGALYHHFPEGKVALFAAVVERVAAEVGDAVVLAAEAAGAEGWSALRAGCRAFLEHSTAPGVARVLLLDGPAVLGPARWRELDDAASGRHLVAALEALVADGVLAPRPVEPLARLLSGAMNEAAVWLAGDIQGSTPIGERSSTREAGDAAERSSTREAGDSVGAGVDPHRFEATAGELDALLDGLRRRT